jgi:hypothetical protein
MMAKSAETMRDLRVAAMGGDPAACRALLRRSGKGRLAVGIRAGKPLPPAARKMVAALCAGTGTSWEYLGADGKIHNDLQMDG